MAGKSTWQSFAPLLPRHIYQVRPRGLTDQPPTQPDDATPTVAKLVFIHGFSDHINRYYDFFPTLARSGIAVYGLDQRGWGRSARKPSEKGLTGPTTQVLSDIAAFITHAHSSSSQQDSVPPLFVMGHSMGGGEVLTLLSTPQYSDSVVGKVRGWLLEGPFLGFDPRDRPSWLKLNAGRLAGKVFPQKQLVNPIPVEWLTRDREAQVSIQEDPLCHNTGTLEGLAGFMDRTAELAEGKLRLQVSSSSGPVIKSLWVGHGDHDRTAWFEACKKWYDTYATEVEDRTFKVYEGWLHQLHAEVGREEFYHDVRDWILARAKGSDNGGARGQKKEGAVVSTTLSSESGHSQQTTDGESTGKMDSKL